MTQNQELKMELLKEFAISEEPKTVDFCREAFKFLTEGENQGIPKAPISFVEPRRAQCENNGVYLIYEDNSYILYTKDADTKNVKYIGIIHDGHAFAVALKDLGEFQLLKDGVKCPEKSNFYVRRECDALNDWECIKRTAHIQELGTDIPLKEGEYIPALPMVTAMCYWAERGLNEALEAVGGEPLDMDSYYWSVTEYDSGSAWNVHFVNGLVYGNYKYGSGVVRPVAEFIL
ncbi:MAG: DUF1566 domain-containing protein [Prevotella sp.]|nr:DUF1566 domain-containing protein [Prevotella sp.]